MRSKTLPDKILIDEACHLLRLSRSTIYRMVRAGILVPAPMPGIRKTFFRREDVLELLDHNAIKTGFTHHFRPRKSVFMPKTASRRERRIAEADLYFGDSRFVLGPDYEAELKNI